MQHIVITGGSGRIATALRSRIVRERRSTLLVDIRYPDPAPVDAHGETALLAGIEDLAALTAAFQGAAAVIHLGGHPSERSWEEIVTTNISGTRNVLEAARRAGVPRVLLASSIHAVGYYRTDELVDVPLPTPRPDSYYGVAKVAMEALGSLYADRFGMKVLSLRIANFADRPTTHRGLSLWFSPDDFARAVEAFLEDTGIGHRIAWGVSRNSRGPLDPTSAAGFGFFAQDDAEPFAKDVPDHAEPWDELLAGGMLAPGRELGHPF